MSTSEKGGGSFSGIKLLLCENPLPPLPEALEAAANMLPVSNFYTEQYSQPLREAIARYCSVPVENVHVNAGSELILRQLMSRYGDHVHLLAPGFSLFEETARRKTYTCLREEDGFHADIDELQIPRDATLAVIVNPNNPNGGVLNLSDRLELLERHPQTMFLVDEAFIEFGGQPMTGLVPKYRNLIVSRTFSKAFSLAGFRVGYVVAPPEIVDWLNVSNDGYPLARASEAAALASLQHVEQIRERVDLLRGWARSFAVHLESFGIETFPSETYFFLGKVPLPGVEFARQLEQRKVLVKALAREGLYERFIRFTTSTPENNAIALEAIAEVLRSYSAHPASAGARDRRDVVDEASWESFPASDAPSWTSVIGEGLKGDW